MCPSNIGRELGRYLNAGADPGGGGGGGWWGGGGGGGGVPIIWK
jgi:hypothetical protein